MSDGKGMLAGPGEEQGTPGMRGRIRHRGHTHARPGCRECFPAVMPGISRYAGPCRTPWPHPCSSRLTRVLSCGHARYLEICGAVSDTVATPMLVQALASAVLLFELRLCTGAGPCAAAAQALPQPAVPSRGVLPIAALLRMLPGLRPKQSCLGSWAAEDQAATWRSSARFLDEHQCAHSTIQAVGNRTCAAIRTSSN